MKTLLVLRHAKSSWEGPALGDHDRPLNKRGRKAAPRMGRLLEERDLVPDRVLCSTAQRARETAERVAEACGFDGDIELRKDLYHASPSAYLDALADLEDSALRVLVVGHNPGMERLVGELSGRYERFPTAALAQIELEIDGWADVREATGVLVDLWLPRELD